MSKFKGLCKALAGFDTTGAQLVRVTFLDASIDYKDTNTWIILFMAQIGEGSDPLLASHWDQLLDRMPYYARQQGSFRIDMSDKPLFWGPSLTEIRRINMRLLRSIDELDRIYAVVQVYDTSGYTYFIRFSSDTGLPDGEIKKISDDGKSGEEVFLNGRERKELKSFEGLKKYFK